MKTSLREGEDIYKARKLLKSWYLRYTKNSQHTRRKNSPIFKKWATDLIRHLTKEKTQMESKHMKGCSTSYLLTELQIKTVKNHYTPLRVKSKTLTTK